MDKKTIGVSFIINGFILLLSSLLLISPNFAIEDFRNVDYITPKLGASVLGQYYYTNDNVDWYWATPSFESNEGYYNIYEVGDTVNFQITVNSTKSGILGLVIYYQGSNGIIDFTNYEVLDLASYSNLRVQQEVTITNTMYGQVYYVWYLREAGTNYFSHSHTFYIKKNLNTQWSYRRLIDISSTEKLKDGTAQITINDTDFYGNAIINYMEDTDTNNYAGIETDLVFTNTDQTKAYPYFINKYKGGYYNHSRETSNNTLIDLWINEDLNNKAVYLYYGFDFLYYNSNIQLTNEGTYLYGGIENINGRTDTPNNPFTVHQVFNDWRWTQTFTENNIADLVFLSSSDRYTFYYHRGENIDFVLGSTYWFGAEMEINNSMYTNNLKNLVVKDRATCGGAPAKNTIYSYNNSHILFYKKSDTVKRLYNSSNNYTEGATYTGIETNIINLENNNLTLKGNLNLNISESLTTFTLEKINFDLTANAISPHSGLYYYQELQNNIITFTIGNQTTTTYAIIQFDSMYEYDTFINDLWLGGIITTDTSGLFICKDIDGSILASIEIDTDSLEGFEITLPYTITNETEFLNRNDFNYTCKYLTDDGFSEESDNLTITFESNRIYLSDILPVTQQNSSSKYVGFKINADQNYTGIDTDFYNYVWKIVCIQLNDNNECLEYDVLNMVFNFSATNISKVYNYYEVEEVVKNNWYAATYKYCKSSNCSSTAIRLFYIYEVPKEIYFPPEEYLDWNDTNITDNTKFMDDMFWNNPLNYLSSFMYQKFIIPNIEGKAQTVFLYVFTIFWNFLFVLLMIAVGVYMKVENLFLTLGVTLCGALLFGYLGWVSISATTLLILVIAGIGLYLKKSGS